jgi:hypothetical protein
MSRSGYEVATNPASRFATALQALHEAAGCPLSRGLGVADSSLSDWRRGKSVPSDARVLRSLTEQLEARAAQRDPDYPVRGGLWWEQRRREAWEASHIRRGGRPAKPQSASEAAPVRSMVQEVPVLGRLITELPAGAALDYEVHQAIDAATMYLVSAGEPAPILPVYIPREQDAELAARVKQVLEGESAIVTLVGESSTGKTRTFWEALQALPAGWRVWHPLRPDEPSALLTGVDAITPHTVVWLNEAQRYLLIPGNNRGEEVAAALRELLRHPARRPVLILATLWPKYWDALTVDHVAGQPDPHAQARALLSGTDIFVPISFTKQDLEKVRTAAAKDWRLEEALEQTEDGQITQYLAGAPQLLQRYRNAPRPAQALIEAAMDLRRLGHGPALPLALLAAAAPSYLSDQEWDEAGDDWLEQALAYTAKPCRGARGPLTRIRPRPGEPAHDQPLYRLAAYL